MSDSNLTPRHFAASSLAMNGLIQARRAGQRNEDAWSLKARPSGRDGTRVDVVWQNIIFAAFLITWIGGVAAIYVRFLKRQLAYLRRFPPVDGVPLDTLGGNPFGARSRAIFDAQLQWQPDPEIERMRRDSRRRGRYVLL